MKRSTRYGLSPYSSATPAPILSQGYNTLDAPTSQLLKNQMGSKRGPAKPIDFDGMLFSAEQEAAATINSVEEGAEGTSEAEL